MKQLTPRSSYETRRTRIVLRLVFVPLLLALPAAGTAQYGQDQRVDSDSPGAANSEEVRIATSGSRVYAVWSDLRNGAYDVYFNYSTDGGASWSADLRLDTDAPGAFASFEPHIATSGASVYVVWADGRNGSSDIYLNYSLDGGVTWQPSDIRIDSDSGGGARSYSPRVAVAGSRVYVVWDEDRPGSAVILMNRSSDGGLTWQTSDTRLDTSNVGGYSRFPEVAVDGSSVWVTWHDTRIHGTLDIYLNYSIDGGDTWLASDVMLNVIQIGSDSWWPRIAVTGNHVCVVWHEYRAGEARVYSSHSGDGGATWTINHRLDTPGPGTRSQALHPQIAVSGTDVYVVWEDSRNGAKDIYFNHSPDGGATWQTADTRLDAGYPGIADSVLPVIGATAGDVFVAWQDRRNGDSDVYFNYSRDRGVTWRTGDVRLDSGPNGTHAFAPQVAVSGASMCVAWMDSRNGNSDVYFAAFDPSFPPALVSRVGRPCISSLEFTPLLSGSVHGVGHGESKWDSNPGQVLTAWDDILINVSLGFSFTFPDGTVTTSVDIDPNGRILVPGQGFSDPTPSVAQMLAGPSTLSLFHTDLDPSQGGRLRFFAGGNHAAITWDEVPQHGIPNALTMQLLLRSDGTFVYSYEDVTAFTSAVAIVGLTRGGGAVDPGEADLTAITGGGHTIYERFIPVQSDPPDLQTVLSSMPGPRLGYQWQLTLDHLAPTVTGAAVLLGASGLNVDLTGIPGLGLDGCLLLVQPALPPLPMTVFGDRASAGIAIPMYAWWVGLPIFAQAYALDSSRTALGVELTNGLVGIVGY